jgi:hypothetical protein
MRRIGVLITADDLEHRTQLAAFEQALQQLGWSDGRNVRFDIRWHDNDADRARHQTVQDPIRTSAGIRSITHRKEGIATSRVVIAPNRR